MLFNIALFSSLLVASVVLAVPSGLGTHIRCSGGIQSHVNNPLEKEGLVFNMIYGMNWASAVWQKDNGTFNFVTGTFTVPTPSGSIGSSAAAWIGIDGDTCQSAILQTGIAFTVESGPPTYFAWYEWYPDIAYNFTGISISAGDVVQLTVMAPSANSGVATIENLTNGQTVTQNLNSSAALCSQNVEWIVEDFYDDNDNQVPFANFSTITFTDTVATGTGKEIYTPYNATIADIEQNNTILTNVSTNVESVTIEYV